MQSHFYFSWVHLELIMYEYCETRVREIFYADKIIFRMSFSLNFYQLEAVGTGFIPANFDIYFTDAYGNVVSDIQKIIADKVSQENTERTFRCAFNLKAGEYSRSAEYFLVIQNTDNGEIVQKVPFQINTAFQKDDFNFMD